MRKARRALNENLMKMLGSEEEVRKYRRKKFQEALLKHYGRLGDLKEIRKFIGSKGAFLRWQKLKEEHGQEGVREVMRQLTDRLRDIYGKKYPVILSLYKVLKNKGLLVSVVREEIRRVGKTLSSLDIELLKGAAGGKVTLEQLLGEGKLGETGGTRAQNVLPHLRWGERTGLLPAY
ncbi:MAG: hypothetical protein J7L59_00800 [Nanoarchaeota archaeon]|nr:hypothetical protein [Nanoarchaeota archaeon]